MKKFLAVLSAFCMFTAMLTGCGAKDAATDTAATEGAVTTSSSDTMIALITMDSIDQHWVPLKTSSC